MKLSKQERIGVLIIAVVIILVLGVIFFVVPKFDEVGASRVNLENKQKEYQAAVDKAAGRDGLKQSIIDAYEKGRDSADMFFTEMTPYELDNEVRAFIDYCKKNKLEILVEDMTVTQAGVEALSISFFEDTPTAQYDLKIYAQQGQAQTEEQIAAANRKNILMSALATSQNVAASKASFQFATLSAEDYIKFVDLVNNYEKTENGKKIRKALTVNGLNIAYEDVMEEYADIMDEIEADVLSDVDGVLKDYAKEHDFEADIDENKDKPADGNTPAAGTDANKEDEDEDDKKGIEDILQTYSVTLTFYCVERMQDPTELLDAQDAA